MCLQSDPPEYEAPLHLEKSWEMAQENAGTKALFRTGRRDERVMEEANATRPWFSLYIYNV